MINITDNFLNSDMYQYIYNMLLSKDFQHIEIGEKSFWIQNSWVDFDEVVLSKINKTEGVKRRNILSFFRLATDKFDTEWNIHADSIIDGERPERALVLYLSPSNMEGLHGTAFWNHKSYGDSLPTDISFENYDEVLLKDCNDMSKWDLHSIVGYKVNRAISYPCSYFHSKYPNLGWADGRMVYVIFYK